MGSSYKKFIVRAWPVLVPVVFARNLTPLSLKMAAIILTTVDFPRVPVTAIRRGIVLIRWFRRIFSIIITNKKMNSVINKAAKIIF